MHVRRSLSTDITSSQVCFRQRQRCGFWVQHITILMVTVNVCISSVITGYGSPEPNNSIGIPSCTQILPLVSSLSYLYLVFCNQQVVCHTSIFCFHLQCLYSATSKQFVLPRSGKPGSCLDSRRQVSGQLLLSVVEQEESGKALGLYTCMCVVMG